MLRKLVLKIVYGGHLLPLPLFYSAVQSTVYESLINFVSRVLVSLISRQERTTLCATAAVPLDKVNVRSGNKIDQQQIFSVLRNFNARVLNMKQMMMKSTQKFAHAAPVIYDLVPRSYHFLLRGMRRGPWERGWEISSRSRQKSIMNLIG